MAHEDTDPVQTVLTRRDVRDFVLELRTRDFCFDSPADFRAGVEAMARLVEERLPSEDGSEVRSSA